MKYHPIKNIYQANSPTTVSYPIYLARSFKHIAETNSTDIIIVPFGKSGKKMLLIPDSRLKEFIKLLK